MSTTLEAAANDLHDLGHLLAERDRLQASIAEVQDRIAAKERAHHVDQLAAIRQDLRESREPYEAQKPILLAQQTDYENGRRRIRDADAAISESLSEKDAVCDILPDDPVSQAWQKAHDALLVKRAQHLAAFQALPDPETLGREHANLLSRINGLEYAESNLINRIEGRSGKAFAAPGGVYAVR